MYIEETKQKSPWMDLLTLMLITLLSVFSISALIAVLGLLGFDQSSFTDKISPDNLYSGSYLYILLGLSSLGTFLLPAFVYQQRYRGATVFPMENSGNWKPYLLGILFLFAFSPFMSLISEWNMQIRLPEAWERIEQWMRLKENEMAVLTEQIVMTSSWKRLILNIVIMAILPGIGEELFFRGALQQIGTRIFKNEYIAIWVVALIFSAIHLQFFGFFPRLLLGAFFGYLVIWTKNIWTAVFAHFINNGTVVVWGFYYARQGKSYTELMGSNSYPVIVYIGSLFISIIVAFIIYRYTTKTYNHGKRMD